MSLGGGGGGFSNPIVDGDTLVRNAIESENYAPGTLGWRIATDGSAEFNDGTFRGGAVFGGAAGQTRIQLGGTLPAPLGTYQLFSGGADATVASTAEIFFNAGGGGDDYHFTALFNVGGIQLYIIEGMVLNGVVIETAPGRPFGRWRSFSLAGTIVRDRFEGVFEPNATSPEMSYFKAASAQPADRLILASWVSTFDPNGVGTDPREDWHAPGSAALSAFGAGFSGRLRVQMVPSPRNAVAIVGTVSSPIGQHADGTTLATLGAIYRPVTTHDIPATSDAIAGAGQSPHWNITVGGAIQCYGLPNGVAVNCGINGIIYRDF